jgi:hypothetical protein
MHLSPFSRHMNLLVSGQLQASASLPPGNVVPMLN